MDRYFAPGMPALEFARNTLIASLPHLPPNFDVVRPPITRPRLLDRFRMLNAGDQQAILAV